jgi:hypothetical protein
VTRSAVPALAATIAYLILTLALTWPLAAGITRDIPGDFGDPLFTSWVLAWDATHLGRGWWNANIFAPHPLSLAYSEHFLPQALQILPIYFATNNPILCYNLLFLSTFVLSGLGMFLLGRELTGSPAAGFVAGLAYAFTPYRIASIPHLQVLSSAWMPFVLYGFHRYFATRRLVPLCGAAAAWMVQNLSCGYYLLFFSPSVLLYLVWELSRRRLWTNTRVLLSILGAAAAVALATLPFLIPYAELRRLGFNPRSLVETRRFSADVYAYFTADPNLRFWGPLAQAWPKAEGLLFPGVTIAGLAATAVWRTSSSSVRAASSPTEANESALPPVRHARLYALAGLAFVAVVALLLLGRPIRLPGLRITSLARVLAAGAIAAAAALAASKRARVAVSGWFATPAGFFCAITLFAVVMSFGPDIRARGRVVASTSLYAAFYNVVPGFDGVRVPARYAMIVTLALAALAALGVAGIGRARRRQVSVVAGVLIVLEALAVPIPIDQNSTDYKQTGLAPLPASVATGAAAPAVYGYLAQLPPSAVVAELPLGEPAFDIRYMFYSTMHWKRLVNGYSGGAPQQYELLAQSLTDVASRPDRAWQALAGSQATHVVVHEGFYTGDGGRRLSDWLRARGGREVAAFGSDRVFALR